MLNSMPTLLLDKHTAPQSDIRRAPSGPHLSRYVERHYFSVCIAHRKGGVGKTTTAWYLRDRGCSKQEDDLDDGRRLLSNQDEESGVIQGEHREQAQCDQSRHLHAPCLLRSTTHHNTGVADVIS
jgi:hypothetical protein